MLTEQTRTAEAFCYNPEHPQRCKQGQRCAARGLGSFSPYTFSTAASQGDECLLFSYFSLLFTLLWTEKTPNSNKDLKAPYGSRKDHLSVVWFFSARETREIAPVCQDKFYKKCQVSHKPSRTIKKIIRNMKKMSSSNQTAASSEISHAWRIQVSEQTCGGHVPTNDSHWFYRCCSCIAQRRFPNSLSIHTTKSTALKSPPSPELCS